MTNNKQLSLNILISILNQLVIIVCGFILPRVLLESFGSTVNGLVTSIRQFLNFITFLEMGIGVVISSSLYEPLFKQDTEKVSAIIVSSKRFFNKLVLYFTFFLVVLVFTYPFFVVEFNFIYVSILMVILSLNLYSQYYFGIVNQLLLTADQKNYIPQGLSMVTVILNTLATAVIVNYSKNVHVVFLSTSFIYLARPLVMDIYVRK
ncbi:TPA: sugar isomerase, partial [Streptococcus suis]